jgi:hypothetical protein
MSDNKVGTATVMVRGRKFEDIPVYAYHDPETNTNYRSIFLSELSSDRDVDSMPEMASIKYRGRTYRAKKFGNPNNQIPTYDFTVDNKV